MTDDRTFLRRWSRRKHEAARATPPPAEPPPPAAALAVAAPETVAAAPAEPPTLPPVESLTLASDFEPFLAAKVEETVKRAALRKLFSDPHFNVMDGLDVYIDDYSKPDPMPDGFLDKLADVYKTIEEKLAQAAPSDTAATPSDSAAPVAADAQATAPAEPSPNTDRDADERQG